jgi:hypothetical protein
MFLLHFAENLKWVRISDIGSGCTTHAENGGNPAAAS